MSSMVQQQLTHTCNSYTGEEVKRIPTLTTQHAGDGPGQPTVLAEYHEALAFTSRITKERRNGTLTAQNWVTLGAISYSYETYL